MNDTYLEIATRWWGVFGGFAMVAIRITVIVIAAWLVTGLLQRAVRRLRERIASRMDDRESSQRAETLGRVVRYLIAVVISLITAMLVLAELGVSVAPILGAAGVVGLAVGFGAQSLVKDYFTGFFLLLENQIRQGDVVQLGNHSGSVEEVTLRYVQLRDYSGNVHYVPNSTITTVINMTRGFSNAVMDIGVVYRENVDDVMTVMREVAAQMREQPAYRDKILGDLDIAGVESWGDSAVVIRCRFRTLPIEQWGVKREYLRRVKSAFDAKGIEIPYPQRVLHVLPGETAVPAAAAPRAITGS